VAGICATHTALADAPHDDAFEPSAFDAARLRTVEERRAAAGTRWLSVAAVETRTGAAGLTGAAAGHGGPRRSSGQS
jgi:hypothetical protein